MKKEGIIVSILDSPRRQLIIGIIFIGFWLSLDMPKENIFHFSIVNINKNTILIMGIIFIFVAIISMGIKNKHIRKIYYSLIDSIDKSYKYKHFINNFGKRIYF